MDKRWIDREALNRVVVFEEKIERAKKVDNTTWPGPCPRFLVDRYDPNHCRRCDYMRYWHKELYRAWGIKYPKEEKLK